MVIAICNKSRNVIADRDRGYGENPPDRINLFGSSRFRVGSFECPFREKVAKKPVRGALFGLSDGALRGFVAQELGWILGGMTPVSDGITETDPVAFGMRRMMRRRPGYPVSDCVRKPPDSVSAGSIRFARDGTTGQAAIGHRSHASQNPPS